MRRTCRGVSVGKPDRAVLYSLRLNALDVDRAPQAETPGTAAGGFREAAAKLTKPGDRRVAVCGGNENIVSVAARIDESAGESAGRHKGSDSVDDVGTGDTPALKGGDVTNSHLTRDSLTGRVSSMMRRRIDSSALERVDLHKAR